MSVKCVSKSVLPKQPTSTKKTSSNGEEKYNKLDLEGDDSGLFGFQLISIEKKVWEWGVPCERERDHWVQLIQQEIMYSLQQNDSHTKMKNVVPNEDVKREFQQLRGSMQCADCGEHSKFFS